MMLQQTEIFSTQKIKKYVFFEMRALKMNTLYFVKNIIHPLMAIPLVKGVVSGAIVALPVGPIGIFCLRRMLTQGPAIGLASGFGSATADSMYAITALIGLSFISSWLMLHSVIFRIISSLFLCCLGITILFSKPSRPRATWTRGLLPAYISTLLLTLTNPLIIVSFAALFTILGVNSAMYTIPSLFSLWIGVFIGSSLWWVILSIITYYAHSKIAPETINIINKISGTLIIFFGIITLASIILK